MLSVILIASAPTEPWPIAEYLSAFLIKIGKFYVSSSTHAFDSFCYETHPDFGGCVWGAFASIYS